VFWLLSHTLGYNVMKGTEYFVSLQTSVVLTEEYNVPQNTWRYKRGDAYIDVVIIGFEYTEFDFILHRRWKKKKS
jgi:hypothetical protein